MPKQKAWCIGRNRRLFKKIESVQLGQDERQSTELWLRGLHLPEDWGCYPQGTGVH